MHDDPLFLSHFWHIYVHIFHFEKYQELFNSRSKMAHLPISWIIQSTLGLLPIIMGMNTVTVRINPCGC